MMIKTIKCKMHAKEPSCIAKASTGKAQAQPVLISATNCMQLNIV